MCQVGKDGVIPQQWEEDLYALFTKTNNYSDMGYKIFSSILYEGLELYVDSIIGNYQCGL
jgi:hypothetical protein